MVIRPYAKSSNASSNSDPPLIAVPRFLQHSNCARDNTSTCSCGEEITPLLDGIGYPILPDADENILSVCQFVASCNILKFPAERVASSLVDLWEDLVNDESRYDFLKYHAGWIGHSVLLSVKDLSAAEVIERIIEISCCLDLLCQQHLLAFHTIRSLQTPAIQRVTAWKAVRQPLIRNMEDIVTGNLAKGLDPDSTYRAPRNMLLEYWILSRAYVDESRLLTESMTIQPATSKSSDVETRITALEAILDAMENNKLDNHESEPESTLFDDLSHSGFTSDCGSESWDSTEEELLDEPGSDDLAKRTRERTCIRLQELRDSLHHKLDNLGRDSVRIRLDTKTLADRSQFRSVDPFDERSIFRARAKKGSETVVLS